MKLNLDPFHRITFIIAALSGILIGMVVAPLLWVGFEWMIDVIVDFIWRPV